MERSLHLSGVQPPSQWSAASISVERSLHLSGAQPPSQWSDKINIGNAWTWQCNRTDGLIQRPWKLWKSGTVGASRGEGSLVRFGGPGYYPRKNIGANLCNLVHFGETRSSKVGRKIEAFPPLLKVGQNSPSLPYRFRGPWSHPQEAF